MEVQTDSERVRTVAQDGPRVPRLVGRHVARRAGRAGRLDRGVRRALRRRPDALRPAGRARAAPASATRTRPATTTRRPATPTAATVAQPVKVDNDLYVRDYSKCILCYKCVEACGEDAQNTFAIAVAGRGFDARISTELAVPAARVGVRLLRQLHRRLPDRRADVQVRVRHARGGDLGRVGPDGDRHDLPVLRRRLRGRRSTSRTTGSSRSPRRSTRRSPTATSASRAASASSSCNAAAPTARGNATRT